MKKILSLIFLMLAVVSVGAQNWFKLTAEENGTNVYFDKFQSPKPIDLLYSTDGVNWQTYTWGPNIGKSITLNAGEYVYFKAGTLDGTKTTNAYFSTKSGKYRVTATTGKPIAASGNVMSLLDASCQQTFVPDSAFQMLFASCPQLTSAPELPATTVGKWSYCSMFEATNITVAPALPATNLDENCYRSMFSRCPNLKYAPELPVMTMVPWCYAQMFSGCSALDMAPELPATTLAENCYYGIFDYCPLINYVKVGFTHWDVVNDEPGGLQAGFSLLDVAESGDFVCPAELTRVGCNDRIPLTWDFYSGTTGPTRYIYHGTTSGCTITSPASNTTAEVGSTVTIVVTPSEEYRVTSLSVIRYDNEESVPVVNNTFVMPKSDVYITATASNEYIITVDQAEHGTVSVGGSTTRYPSNTVSITATPDEGYEVDHYVVDGVNQEASVFTMPAKDIHVTAVFREKQYAVSVVARFNCTASCSAEYATAGTTITVNVTPDANCSLDSIIVRRADNNAKISISNTHTFVMPNSITKVYVYCSATKYQISKASTEHGSFEVAGQAIMGDNVAITATPAEGYTVDHYTVDGVLQVANTFTMPAHNVTVGVVFRALTYNVTLYATHCSISYTPATSTIATDTEVTVTVTPETGYHFSSLEVKAGTTPIAVTNNKFTMPAAAIEIYAVCEEDLYTVTAAPTEHGSFTLSHTTNVAKGTTVTITATPDEEYEVDHYVVDGGEQAANTFVMPNHDVTVGVVFVQKTYAATIVAYSGHEASLSATNAVAGAEISINITPVVGSQVDSIIVRRVDNGEKVAVSNDNKFIMPSAAVEVSIYASAIKYHVTVETAENCSVVLSDEEAVMGAQVSLTITPASGTCTLSSIEVERTDTHELLTVTDYSFFMPASDVVVRVIYDDTTGLENLNGDKMVTKILRDGQVLILRGDKMYTVIGLEVK